MRPRVKYYRALLGIAYENREPVTQVRRANMQRRLLGWPTAFASAISSRLLQIFDILLNSSQCWDDTDDNNFDNCPVLCVFPCFVSLGEQAKTSIIQRLIGQRINPDDASNIGETNYKADTCSVPANAILVNLGVHVDVVVDQRPLPVA